MSSVTEEYPTQTLRVTNLISYALLIAVNVASNSGLLGPTNAEISQKYSTPLTPAGWAFSIWGLIFALEGLGVIYAALPHGYNENGWKERTVNAIGYTWQACWLFECVWQLVFLVRTPLGMVACMIFLLVALASMLFGLSRLYALNRGQASLPSILLHVLFFLPTSINAAWLSVASGLGVLIVPLSYGHTAHLEAAAAVTAAVATAAGLLTLQREKDVAYGLTLVWSLTAVYAKHKHVQSVMIVSVIGIVLLGIASAAAIVQKQRQRKYSPMHGGLGEALQS
ncbi:hypothetical protein ABBQ32_010324 [Trebouxia sp. C0010 RCD-2024]